MFWELCDRCRLCLIMKISYLVGIIKIINDIFILISIFWITAFDRFGKVQTWCDIKAIAFVMSILFITLMFWYLKFKLEVTRGMKLTFYNKLNIKKCCFFLQYAIEWESAFLVSELHRSLQNWNMVINFEQRVKYTFWYVLSVFCHYTINFQPFPDQLHNQILLFRIWPMQLGHQMFGVRVTRDTVIFCTFLKDRSGPSAENYQQINKNAFYYIWCAKQSVILWFWIKKYNFLYKIGQKGNFSQAIRGLMHSQNQQPSILLKRTVIFGELILLSKVAILPMSKMHLGQLLSFLISDHRV